MSAFRSGYRHVDTAEFYRNEKDVGKAVRDFLAESGLERKDLLKQKVELPPKP